VLAQICATTCSMAWVDPARKGCGSSHGSSASKIGCT
jgi:hypothetical protein